MKRLLVAAIAALTLVASTPSAKAQDVHNTFRLTASAELVRWDRVKLDDFGDEAKTDRLNAGLTGSHIGFGYSVTDNIVVGVRARFAYETILNSDDFDSTDAFTYSVGPFFEAAFGAGKVKPFILVRAEFAGSKVTLDEESVTQLGATFGGGFGLRIFASNRVSLDPIFEGGYGLGKFKDDFGDSLDFSRGYVSFAVRLSAYFGR